MIRGVSDDGFREVFDRTFPLAERVARRITGDAGMAEEVAAESLTRLFVHWPRLKGEKYVDAWVIRVATNLAIGVVRRRATGVRTELPQGSDEDQAVLRVALAEAFVAFAAAAAAGRRAPVPQRSERARCRVDARRVGGRGEDAPPPCARCAARTAGRPR